MIQHQFGSPENCRTEQATTWAHCFSLSFIVSGSSPLHFFPNSPPSDQNHIILRKKKVYQKFKFHIPWSTIVVLELLTSPSDAIEDRDDVRDNLLLYCLLTAQYSPRAGRVSESLGSKSGESGSNPNPSSMQPLSSSRSSSVTLLLRPSRPDGCLPFLRSQASSRSASGDHECCFTSGLGGGCDGGALRFDIGTARFWFWG